MRQLFRHCSSLCLSDIRLLEQVTFWWEEACSCHAVHWMNSIFVHIQRQESCQWSENSLFQEPKDRTRAVPSGVCSRVLLLMLRADGRFPGEKFHSLDSDQDAVLLLRQLTNQKLKPVHFRKNRPHLVAEFISFEMENDEVSKATGVPSYVVFTPCRIGAWWFLLGWRQGQFYF